jgi:hypothetical protein
MILAFDQGVDKHISHPVGLLFVGLLFYSTKSLH